MHRPLTESFPLCYAWDSAFDQDMFLSDADDEGQPFAGDTPEEREQARSNHARKKYLDAWLRAVEQLDYAAITKQGKQPAVFRCRPLTDDEARKLRRAAQGD